MGKNIYRWVSHKCHNKRRAGIYIKYPNGDQQSEAIPSGLHCSNYKAEEDALTHAAHSIKNKIDNTTQVVFLTDAFSVLQALKNDKLPQLQQALYIKSLTIVLQWIPSHFGVWGNEQAAKLAKHGAEQQEENPVCYTEILRTGQNRLNQHLCKVMIVVPSPMCPCGEAEQDAAHLLQSCKIHQALRDKIWHSETPLKEKLYGPVDALQKTIRFVEETGIQV
ncbi:unnamed protein product [Mytilus coruscus]|uniref:RNase H type-1 domain-containing protein n=1 Tax=Mytilus coruscus TaxID=42192 RepID=A0A6J8D5G7_MYTCO|nr:unnamed protein product [Mytilus coruscus]